jgi:hypothetical protein
VPERADTEGHQGFEQSVGARAHADRVEDTECTGGLAFERLDLGTENKPLGLTDAIERLSELLAQRLVLAGQVEQRDGHGTTSDGKSRGIGYPDFQNFEFRISNFGLAVGPVHT